MKRILLVLGIVIATLFSTGCYVNSEVQSNQIGLQLNDGVNISAVVGAGRYSQWGWFSDLVKINGSALTVTWEDPDLVTNDKQPIGLKLAVTYKRKTDSNSVTKMFATYRAESLDDKALNALVNSRIPDPAKQVTTQYTLDQMLGIDAAGVGRQKVASDIKTLLEKNLNDVFVDLLTVQIVNIQPDTTYLDKLKEKAQAQIDKEIAATTTLTLAEKLNQQKAQTNIDLEIARRQNLVNEEMGKAYKDSPEVFKLKLIEAYKGMFGPADKVVFIPENSSLSIIMNASSGNVVPVPAQ